MSDQDRKNYYRAVPGSRELVTSSTEGDRVLAELEKSAPSDGLAPLLSYQGEWVGGSRFASGLTLPAELFDRLAPEQSPLEQAVFFHLFRLSFGEGRNWCRVGKRELMRRTRVSERRLNVALDGLVNKGHLKPLHRSTRGTLYRVFLPSEVLGLQAEPGLELGQRPGPLPAFESEDQAAPPPAPAPPRKKPRSAAVRERPLESPLNEERFADVAGRKPGGPSVAGMADRFFELRGLKPKPTTRQMAVSVVTGLLEDGFTRAEVGRALEWFAENQPGEKTLDRLPYFMTTALEEGE